MRAESGGAGIEFEVTGEGRPLILLHGFPDSGRLWRHQIAPLADAGFQVIVPDMRGYGASDKPAEVDAYNILYLVADVGAVLDEVGVRARARGRARLGRRGGLGPRRDGARSRRPSRRAFRGPPFELQGRRLRTAREVVVHAPLPLSRHRRAVALQRRMGQPPGLGRPSRRGCGDRRTRGKRFAHARAQLVPGQHPPRVLHCAAPGPATDSRTHHGGVEQR